MIPRSRVRWIPASSRRGCAGRATGSANSGGAFDEAALRSRIEALELDAARPDLWDDRERAEKLLREKSSLERDLAQVDRLAEMLEDVEVLLELADEADDASTRAEAAEKLAMTKDFLYRHADEFPFTVRPTSNHLRFSLRGIEKFIRQRTGISMS